MIRKILIANRGEIACRIIRTAKRMGIRTVAVYSEADTRALHVREADEALPIGGLAAAESYLVVDKILAATRQSGADAVHPGYGFLSENAALAEKLEEHGVIFIGPPAAAMRAMGDKITSKKLAAQAGVCTVPGQMGLIDNADEAASISRAIGFPVMIKASAGGGGKGMRIARNENEARAGFTAACHEARAAFGDERIFIEKFITGPRHIEIQVLGDRHGHLIHLNERECSIQRRNQKVIEEAPSPFLDPPTRAAMAQQALALAQTVGYHSAGTVEFIVDGARNFYFLEMNTRLQVEHAVTEMITGLDLVEWMIRIADGEALPLQQQDIKMQGWAMECRLYAEDPYRNFLPATGRLTRYRPPAPPPGREAGLRHDGGFDEGSDIPLYYDPMMAKLISWGKDRATAIAAMRDGLDRFEIEGVGHNLPFLATVLQQERFQAGRLSTAYIAEEFADGFKTAQPGHRQLRALAAIAAFVNHRLQQRASLVSGTLDNHRRVIGNQWVVTLGGQNFELTLHTETDRLELQFADHGTMTVTSPWLPGQTLGLFDIGAGAPMIVKVEIIRQRIRLRCRAADIIAYVREPHVARLAQLMPDKQAPDTSRLLLCPMPGIITAILAREGEVVEEGQPLATIEAMKMENMLRADKKGTIAHIGARVGQSLAVNHIIMEFES